MSIFALPRLQPPWIPGDVAVLAVGRAHREQRPEGQVRPHARQQTSKSTEMVCISEGPLNTRKNLMQYSINICNCTLRFSAACNWTSDYVAPGAGKKSIVYILCTINKGLTTLSSFF